MVKNGTADTSVGPGISRSSRAGHRCSTTARRRSASPQEAATSTQHRAAVRVEDELAAREPIGDRVQQREPLVPRQVDHETLGHDECGAVRRDSLEPCQISSPGAGDQLVEVLGSERDAAVARVRALELGGQRDVAATVNRVISRLYVSPCTRGAS